MAAVLIRPLTKRTHLQNVRHKITPSKTADVKVKSVFAYLELFIAVTQCCHLVFPVPSNQFAQRADQLIISHTVHVHLLLLMLQTLEPSEVRVRHGLDEPVASERLLVGMCRSEALLTIWHLTRHACFDSILWGVLLTELALDRFRRGAWAGHSGADGDQRQPVIPFLTRWVGPAVGCRQWQWKRNPCRRWGSLNSINDILQGNVSLQSL